MFSKFVFRSVSWRRRLCYLGLQFLRGSLPWHPKNGMLVGEGGRN